jgi:hypothetical protein
VSDFPGTTLLPPVISIASPHAFGGSMICHTLQASASATWPTNNLGIFIPFSLPAPYVVRSLYSVNGATASGNLDMGIFALDGTLIVSKGSTAQSGTDTLQILSVTATLLSPGRYFVALSSSTTAATFYRNPYGAAGQGVGGILQASSQLPLANLPTFATPANSYVPLCGLASITSY